MTRGPGSSRSSTKRPAPDGVLLIPEGTRITYTIVTCEAKGGRKKCPPGSY